MPPTHIATPRCHAQPRLLRAQERHIVIGLAVDLRLLATEDVGLATDVYDVIVVGKSVHCCIERRVERFVELVWMRKVFDLVSPLESLLLLSFSGRAPYHPIPFFH